MDNLIFITDPLTYLKYTHYAIQERSINYMENPDYRIQFVQDTSLADATAGEVESTGTMPVDKDGNYDPFVELNFKQFCKLTLNEQVDYLLASTHTTMKEWNLLEAKIGIELPSGGIVSIHLEKNAINPRALPKLNRYGGYDTSTLNYGKYAWVSLSLSDEQGQHNIHAHSALFRTVVIGLLLSFLIKFKPEKYVNFTDATAYYVTALILGNQRPLKYKPA